MLKARSFVTSSLGRSQGLLKEVELIGAPSSSGQPIKGVEAGPGLLRSVGLHDRIKALGRPFRDSGDLPFPTFSSSEDPSFVSKEGQKAHRSRAVGSACRLLSDAFSTSLRAGRLPVMLGGDHSLAIGSLHGVVQAEPSVGVIWVDAHADYNTLQTSPSGNIHGMPVAGLQGALNEVPSFEWMKGTRTLPSHAIVFIGLRDVDPGESVRLAENNILCFSGSDVHRLGIEAVMEKSLTYLKRATQKIHLSFDIDACDPSIAPSTGTRVDGGLTRAQALTIGSTLFKSRLLISMDLVEVNPAIGSKTDAHKTASLGVDIIAACLGEETSRV